MSEIIKRIQRQHHLQHLTQIAPFITVAYLLQCYMMASFFKDVGISQFAIPLAISLAVMLGALVIYDCYHYMNICEDGLEIGFTPLNIKTNVPYSQIKEVEVFDPEAHFSTLILHFHNDSKKIIYFVDEAILIKAIIDEIMKIQNENQTEIKKAA
jgi:hypothetical protein